MTSTTHLHAATARHRRSVTDLRAQAESIYEQLQADRASVSVPADELVHVEATTPRVTPREA